MENKKRKNIHSSHEMYKKIEEIYNTEKGKKFISHLIQNFFPEYKIKYMFFPKKANVYCCISGKRLSSKSEMIESGAKNYKKKKISEDSLGIECDGSNKFLCHGARQQLYSFLLKQIMNGDSYIKWISKKAKIDEGVSFLSIREQKTICKKEKPSPRQTLGDFEELKKLKNKLN